MKKIVKQNQAEKDNSGRNTAPNSPVKNLQRKWANWIERRTTHLERYHWLIVLALFVLLAGGYNLCLLYGSFTWKGKTIFSVFPIQKPALFREAGNMKQHSDSAFLSGEYKRIHQFRIYMDSLKQSPSGRSVYDSILLHRPGLLDSVLFIEKHYQSSN